MPKNFGLSQRLNQIASDWVAFWSKNCSRQDIKSTHCLVKSAESLRSRLLLSQAADLMSDLDLHTHTGSTKKKAYVMLLCTLLCTRYAVHCYPDTIKFSLQRNTLKAWTLPRHHSQPRAAGNLWKIARHSSSWAASWASSSLLPPWQCARCRTDCTKSRTGES